tara:strand:- start:430 stop:735 length:306 start_codon:yes stop_codon:yes gene_type:complete
METRYFILTVQVIFINGFGQQPIPIQFTVPYKSEGFPNAPQALDTLNFALEENGLDKWMPQELNCPGSTKSFRPLGDSLVITNLLEVPESDYLQYRAGNTK